ncbi:MAG: hypothetical protein JW936_05595 [Sedimentisphaerales bacterium]|nr:hypothetical protein [Sedimentisphaerales bacterium]
MTRESLSNAAFAIVVSLLITFIVSPVSAICLDIWHSENTYYSQGWAIGQIKYFPPEDIQSAYDSGQLLPTDILLTDTIPAEVPLVAGIITTSPEEPSQDVILFAESHNLPLAYIRQSGCITIPEMPTPLPITDHQVLFSACPDMFLRDLAHYSITEEQIQELLQLKQLNTETIPTFLLSSRIYYHTPQWNNYIFDSHRLKSRWTIQTPSLWLTPENLSDNILTDIAFEYQADGQIRFLDGPPTDWPDYNYYYDGNDVIVNWTLDTLAEPRFCELRINDIPTTVPADECPIFILSEYLFKHDLSLITFQVQYQNPVPDNEDATTDSVSLWPRPTRFFWEYDEPHLIYSTPGGISIRTGYILESPPAGWFNINNTDPLAYFDHTIIEGLTTEPIVLNSYYSQTYRAPTTWWGAPSFIFEPQLEPDLPQQTLDELQAQDIRLIYVRKENGTSTCETYGFNDALPSVPPYPLHISYCTVLPHPTQTTGSFVVVGTMESLPESFSAHPIDITFGSYTESLTNFTETPNLCLYRGAAGGISLFLLNKITHQFILFGSNVELAGLSSPVNISLRSGDHLSFAQYQLDNIPLTFMKGHTNTLTVDSVTPLAYPYHAVRGRITIADPDFDPLQNDINISWPDHEVRIRAGSLTQNGNTFYRYHTNRIFLAIFDLDKCTYYLIIQEHDLPATGELTIQFDNFNESAQF